MGVDLRALRGQLARMRRGWGRWAADLLRAAPMGDLTLRQVALLMSLDREQSAGELGAFLGWPASEVARDARALARDGFVTCEGGPDAGALRIHASERGAYVLAALLELRARATADLIAALSLEDQRAVARAIALLAEAAERVGRVAEPA
ncbi:MAG: hypothetical protein ACOZNI_15640 [Myxococcota bacterium]